MDDLISRQAAIAEFSCCQLTPDGGIDANYAIDFLKQLPAAQPERRGEWVKDGETYALYKCSACNEIFPEAGWANCIKKEQMYNTFKFCPHCGARMEEQE